MLPKGKVRGDVETTFIQVLKTVVLIGDVALDKSVLSLSPTPGNLGT